MKILYIITQGEWGGAQKYVFDLATGLASDYEIAVAIGEPLGKKDLAGKIETWNGQHESRNIEIVQLKHLVRKISPFHDLLAIFELAKLYKKTQPDIAHLNSTKAGIIGSIAKLLLKPNFRLPRNGKMKIIYTVHGWVFHEPLKPIIKWLYKFLEKTTAGNKNRIIVLSENDVQSGLKLVIDENKLIKIPLGINEPKFLDKETARKEIVKLFQPKADPPVAENSYNLEDDTLVGTIANLYPTKGLNILIEAVKKVKNSMSIDNIKFVIIGEGEERGGLQSLIDKYGLNNNIFLPGAIADAAGYLPAFDLFVLPSLKEGLPYTIMEAMARRVPIIATNVGGVASLINDENGFLVNPMDSEELANAILWCLENPDEMRKRAVHAGSKIKEYTLEKMINKTKKVYQGNL